MLKEKLKTIPHLPGSYQMRNINNTVIYVGKAKDLYKRVNSYFKGNVTGKTAKMVSEVVDFTYITTSTEQEAFILELNLIKEYDPKYNILLKDDKSYPYIEYISKPYPKLKVSRYLSVKRKDKKLLFGPYPNAYAARKIVNLINRLYPLKKCEGMPKDVCLYYHIHECLGYCKKDIDQEKIDEMEKDILSFLRGNEDIIKSKLKEKIEAYSEAMNYELALELKKELDYMTVVLEKQKVELNPSENLDVINYAFKNGFLSLQILFVRNGKLIGANSEIYPVMENYLEELEYYIAMFYNKKEIPKEILLPDEVDDNILKEIIDTKFIRISKGSKRKLLNMAKENAEINLDNNFERYQQKLNKTSGVDYTTGPLGEGLAAAVGMAMSEKYLGSIW